MGPIQTLIHCGLRDQSCLTLASVIILRLQGSVPTLNCIALKMERTVKASAVASSMPGGGVFIVPRDIQQSLVMLLPHDR